MIAGPRICDFGGNGLIFPLVSNEHEWHPALRGTLYALGMLYCFLGVAIISDMFMSAIEKVTSKRKQVKNEDGRVRTTMWWNETVATLTLMALGSSAPEICLSIIDIIKKGFHFGELGASTIVGSAAFNLLIIIAVCVWVIPSGEARIIENRPAFYITALFSLLAYMWMAFILTHSSPQIVDVWEAVLTFLFLPILVYISYKFDKGDADWLIAKCLPRKVLEEEGEAAPVDVSKHVHQDKVTFDVQGDDMVVPGSSEARTLEVVVRRTVVADTPVTLLFKTEAIDAVPGFDFEATEGELTFLARETEQKISVSVHPRARWRSPCRFLVILAGLEGESCFDPEDDGGEDSTILTVHLDRLPAGEGGARSSSPITTLDRIVPVYSFAEGFADWKDQVFNVIYCNGSLEEQREASKVDWACHLVALPWKCIFVCFPPTSFCGGWVSFCATLIGIGALTACLSDLAELFGCVLDVPDIVTAITFVAMGTSMPDLFASFLAAKEDPTADASIVNVTGSNSVNVFLGLGVPWTVAAIYWQVVGRTAEWEAMYPEIASTISGSAFVVESRNLGFSVLSFCVVCCVALLLLHLRRKWLGGELGGPACPKINTFLSFIGLWVGWVCLVSWRVLRYETVGLGAEAFSVQGSACGLLVVCTGVAVFQMHAFHRAHMAELAAIAASARQVAQVDTSCFSARDTWFRQVTREIDGDKEPVDIEVLPRGEKVEVVV